MIGSLFSATGISLLMKAIECGPVGPAVAICGAYPPLLLLIEAVKNH